MDLHRPVVLALPRGGVPVGFEIASVLQCPLDVFVARKVGAPGHVEYGIGAVAEGGGVVAVLSALRSLGISQTQFDALAAAGQLEVERRVQIYRGARQLPDLCRRDVVVVDDGLATGVTAEAAARAVRALEPRRLVLAVPAGAASATDRLRNLTDEIVCSIEPDDFYAVGALYQEFDQTSDDEVLHLLEQARPFDV